MLLGTRGGPNGGSRESPLPAINRSGIKRGKRRRPRIPAIAAPFGQVMGCPKEKAEYLVLCFEIQFTPNPPMDRNFDKGCFEHLTNLTATVRNKFLGCAVQGVSKTCLLYTSRCV